jgi:hypothetical protein
LKLVGNYKIIDSDTGKVLLDVKDKQLSIKTAEIERGFCEECGESFIKTHGRQRFCPPSSDIKRSRCENTFNQRLKRQRKSPLD